jgi:hypothetical protein
LDQISAILILYVCPIGGLLALSLVKPDLDRRVSKWQIALGVLLALAGAHLGCAEIATAWNSFWRNIGIVQGARRLWKRYSTRLRAVLVMHA